MNIKQRFAHLSWYREFATDMYGRVDKRRSDARLLWARTRKNEGNKKKKKKKRSKRKKEGRREGGKKKLLPFFLFREERIYSIEDGLDGPYRKFERDSEGRNRICFLILLQKFLSRPISSSRSLRETSKDLLPLFDIKVTIKSTAA